jgi:hypothetical protein
MRTAASHRPGWPAQRPALRHRSRLLPRVRPRRQLLLGMPRFPSRPPRALHPPTRLHRARQYRHRSHRVPHRPTNRPSPPPRCPTTLRRPTHRRGHLSRRWNLGRRVDPCQLPLRVGDSLGSSWTRSRSHGQNWPSSVAKPTTIKPRSRSPTSRRATRPKAAARRPAAKLAPKGKAGQKVCSATRAQVEFTIVRSPAAHGGY